MELTCPTLLLTDDTRLRDDLARLAGESSEYLVHAPHWEAFRRLVAQLVFGVAAADYRLLTSEAGEGEGPDGRVSEFIEETFDSSTQTRLLLFNVPDGEALDRVTAAGVHDAVRAPLSVEELGLRAQKACETYSWLAQRNYYRGKSGHIFEVDDIVGESAGMERVFTQVRKVAPSTSPVLITGETGTGKELIAAAIHYNSPRRDQAFIKVNCAALQDTLLESDLFGHEKGAFTGAVRQRIGRFEQAHGGTLFLDEIGEMSPGIQAKVLRVLQTQEFERVGGTRLIRVNVRIIAATNRDLEHALRRGTFREDLYYRLNVVTIRIPPLRERTSDIPLLARFFLKKAQFEEKRPELELGEDALAFMRTYPWPGNVRELENTVMQAVLLSEGPRIRREDLSIFHRPPRRPEELQRGGPEPSFPEPEPAGGERGGGDPGRPGADREEAMETTGAAEGEGGAVLDLEEVERQAIVRALESTGHVQSRAARLLGISRRSLNYKISKYGITHPSWRVNR
ncbi:MAG: sigma-54 dependent transcriptional regulator [bacterium]